MKFYLYSNMSGTNFFPRKFYSIPILINYLYFNKNYCFVTCLKQVTNSGTFDCVESSMPLFVFELAICIQLLQLLYLLSVFLKAMWLKNNTRHYWSITVNCSKFTCFDNMCSLKANSKVWDTCVPYRIIMYDKRNFEFWYILV